MQRWVGKIAVVTGASAGIGLATAKHLLAEGMTVVSLARSKSKIENAMRNFKGKGKFCALECDVSRENDVIETFEWIEKNIGIVQVLVNNAGIAKFTPVLETWKDEWQELFQINVMGLLMCTKLAVKMMRQANLEGHVININSIIGHRVSRTLPANVYPATKHAITAITETCQNELIGDKIRVTSISPGVVRTELATGVDDSERIVKLEPDDIANSIVYVIGTPQRVQITELTIKPLGEKF